jgi:hypothetical protein
MYNAYNSAGSNSQIIKALNTVPIKKFTQNYKLKKPYTSDVLLKNPIKKHPLGTKQMTTFGDILQKLE